MTKTARWALWQSSSVRTANGFALLGEALADDDGDEIRFVVERKPERAEFQ